MKKVLALVLAVMMLATVAFATGIPNRSENATETPNTVEYGGHFAPGETIYIYRGMWDKDGAVDDWSAVTDSGDWNAEINSKNYSIRNRVWDQGGELVAGVEFDDKNDQLKIKLKENFTLTQPKKVVGRIRLTGKGRGGDSTDPRKGKKPAPLDISINVTVGNWKQSVGISIDEDVVLETNGRDASDERYVNDGDLIQSSYNTNGVRTVVTSNEIYDNAVQKFTGAAYGNVIIECADDKDTEVTFRAYKGDETFLFNDTDSDDDLLKAYADEDAEISFLNFVANPTLNSTATIRFYKDEDSHVYEMKDGKLTREIKWDDDADCFLLKTRTLGSYVFSDKALPFNVSTPSNPDTGANDVVGIATALAAVALVSAAAVSLKK